MCDHCQAKILEPMIPATTPESLDARGARARRLPGSAGLPAVGRVDAPERDPLRALLPGDRAAEARLSAAQGRHPLRAARRAPGEGDGSGRRGHRDDGRHRRRTRRSATSTTSTRPVEDFEATLAALCATTMEVVPHIVIGLHYGRILGEPAALDIVSRHPIHSLVLVVVMPFYAKPGTFATPGDERRRPDLPRGAAPDSRPSGAARLRAAAGDAPARDRRVRRDRRASTASRSPPTARSRSRRRSAGRRCRSTPAARSRPAARSSFTRARRWPRDGHRARRRPGARARPGGRERGRSGGAAPVCG